MSLTELSPTIQQVILPLSTNERKGQVPDLDLSFEVLEDILDTFKHLRGENTPLFDWGAHAVTLFHSTPDDDLKDVLGVYFEQFSKNRELEKTVNEFSTKMFSWFTDIQVFLTVEQEEPGVDYLKNMIEKKRQHKNKIAALLSAPLPGSQQVLQEMQQRGCIPEFVKEYIQKEKESLETQFSQEEQLIQERMSLQEKQFKIKYERLQIEIFHAENELERTQIELSFQKDLNLKNQKKVKSLQANLKQLKDQVRRLEEEVADSGGCTIS